MADLPGDWMQVPAPASTKDFGTRLLKNADYPVLRFPSIIIPNEYNYILNPLHAGIDSIEIVSVKDFLYDVRIKRT
jgi:hypothetical protein